MWWLAKSEDYQIAKEQGWREMVHAHPQVMINLPLITILYFSCRIVLIPDIIAEGDDMKTTRQTIQLKTTEFRDLSLLLNKYHEYHILQGFKFICNWLTVKLPKLILICKILVS